MLVTSGEAESFIVLIIFTPQIEHAGTIPRQSVRVAPVKPWSVNYRCYKFADRGIFKAPPYFVEPNFVDSPPDWLFE
jgi:hypothetical protein